jgi:hypothetical protein
MMNNRVKYFETVQKAAWRFTAAMFCVLALSTAVVQVTNVVATSGFVYQIGVDNILLLWIIDMAITLVATGAYSLVADHVQRTRLVYGMLLGLAALYLGTLVLFQAGAPPWLTYPLLYLVSDQQFVIFPLAFWALANDTLSMADAKNIFPIITAGTVVGSLLGNGATVAAAQIYNTPLENITATLWLSVAMLLTGFVVFWFIMRGKHSNGRQETRDSGALQKTIDTGLDFLENVPSFAYLALAMVFGSLAFTILEYHFLYTLDVASRGADAWAQFQTFYSFYRVGFFICTWLFQWLITSRLLTRTQLRDTFTLLPSILIGAVVGALALPNIIGGTGGRFIARVIQRGWDEPARKTLQNLIPDEKRGRVGAFMDGYLYAVATIIGCTVLASLFFLGSAHNLPDSVVRPAYLIIAGLAGSGALLATFRMRRVYDNSLLNWRLARARRKAVVDLLKTLES